MKKKFLVLIICLCSILFCGCSVPPQYTIAQKSDGTVQQLVYIPFSGAELQKVGLDIGKISQLSSYTKQKFDSYFNNMYTNFVTRVSTDTGLTSADKLTLLGGCPSQADVKGKGDFNGIQYELNFASAIHYYYFNMGLYYEDLVNELKKDESIKENSFFTNKIINQSKTIYGVNTQFDENNTFAEYITSQCRQVLTENTTLTSEQIESIVPKTFVYRYGTPTKKLHSDADVLRFIDGVYYHEWNITLENSGREISTWTISPNRNVWYAIILLLALLLLAILIIVYYFKHKKEHPRIIIEEPK